MSDQRSTTDQMADVLRWAVKEGMYDAADWIERSYFIYMGRPSPRQTWAELLRDE